MIGKSLLDQKCDYSIGESMDIDELCRHIKEIAPNFRSKFEMKHSSYNGYRKLEYHFANEKGGIGDYENEYGKNDIRENNSEIFYKLAKSLENVEIDKYYNPIQATQEHQAIVEIFQYYRQLDYRWLNKEDLYQYFSWRDTLRRVFRENTEEQENDDTEYLKKPLTMYTYSFTY